MKEPELNSLLSAYDSEGDGRLGELRPTDFVFSNKGPNENSESSFRRQLNDFINDDDWKNSFQISEKNLFALRGQQLAEEYPDFKDILWSPLISNTSQIEPTVFSPTPKGDSVDALSSKTSQAGDQLSISKFSEAYIQSFNLKDEEIQAPPKPWQTPHFICK